MSLLNAENISLSFKNQKIFDNANLIIDKPGLYFLMGRNGSGKTTFFKAVTGKLKLSKGSINLKYGTADVSYCNADPLVFNNLTVKENIELVCNDDNKILELSKIFGLDSILDMNAKKCSAGEKQRITIIRTIIENKSIILLDEVTSHLDDITSNVVLSYLKKLSKTHVIIYSTHYEFDTTKYADYIININDYKFNVTKINGCDNDTMVQNNSLNFLSEKLLKKATKWKPDIIFNILFSILATITLLILWLVTLSPTRAYAKCASKTDDGKYSIINSLYKLWLNNANYKNTNDQQFLTEFIKNNSKVGFGIDHFIVSLPFNENYKSPDDMKTKNYQIDYILIDENIDDNCIWVSSELYQSFSSYKFIDSNGDMDISGQNFKVKELSLSGYQNDRVWYDYYLVANELTFKKFIKISNVNTISNSTYEIIQGRAPENDNEIILEYHSWYGDLNFIGTTYTLSMYGAKKEVTITGMYVNPDYLFDIGAGYLVTDDAYDYFLDSEDVNLNYNIAYANPSDLTDDDYQNLLEHNYGFVNDCGDTAYYIYEFVKENKRPFIISIIFLIVFDTLSVLYYMSYQKLSTSNNLTLIKILNKEKIALKNILKNKLFNCLFITAVSFSIFAIAQFFISKLYGQTVISYYYIANSEKMIDFKMNDFLYYAIPVIILIEFVTSCIQVRRVVK